MTDNLRLWQSVEKTDTSQTRAITGKPYQGTSPKPYYLVRKATETFGPCGIGWGFVVVSERVEDGAAGDKVHIAHVRVWYKWNGERGEIEHVGQTMFAGKRNNGNAYTDEDAPKKSVTDALVKALSMIGFAGDIFMGRFDDSKYVDELKREERQQAATTVVAVPQDDPEDIKQRDFMIASMRRTRTPEELRAWGKDNKASIGKLSQHSQDAIRDAYTAANAAVKPRENEAA